MDEILTIDQIVEIADQNEYIDPESGHTCFDRLGFARGVIAAAQLAAAPAAVQPVAVFDGYLDGGNAIIKWRGKGLPAGTLLYAVQSAPLSI